MNFWGGAAFGNSWFHNGQPSNGFWPQQMPSIRPHPYAPRPSQPMNFCPLPPSEPIRPPMPQQMMPQTGQNNMHNKPSAYAASRKDRKRRKGAQLGGPVAKRQKSPVSDVLAQHRAPDPYMDAPEMTYEDKLSLTIWRNYLDFRQSNELFNTKQELRRTLCDLLEPFGDNCVFIVGSSINGFGSKKSDLDLCLHITADQSRLSHRISTSILVGIKTALYASRLFTEIQFVPARVPILKFMDVASRIEIDLNLNNTPGIFNTRLLALYCGLDWRVRPLGMFFKHWARQCDIHDASRGRLSSYSLNLMLIHFLQCGCNPPVLPCLQRDFPDLFTNYQNGKHVVDMSIGCVPQVLSEWRSRSPENGQSLAQLFRELIEYYHSRADFEQRAFSVRLGRPIPLRVAVNQQPADELRRIQTGRSNSKIFLEEPFTLSNASRSPFDDTVYSLVKRAFGKTSRFLKLRKDISTVAPV